MRQKHRRKIHVVKKHLNRVTKGKAGLYVMLILAALGFAFLSAAGSSFPRSSSENTTSTGTNQTLSCCDTGDGADCQPQTGTGKTIRYNNTDYGLLRSNATFQEGNFHLADSGQETQTGYPIIINTSESYSPPPNLNYPPNFECADSTHDSYWGGPKPTLPPTCQDTSDYPQPECQDGLRGMSRLCFRVPDDEIIFACKTSCRPGSIPNSYGDAQSTFDVYFKLSDYPVPGIPDKIKNCDKSGLDTSARTTTTQDQQFVITPPAGPESKLQINTFKVITDALSSPELVPWLSPFCKPAIYLYPESTQLTQVQVKPKGPITYSDPEYPENGWLVLAHPSGLINYQNQTYPYLYYEAEIPDSAYEKPQEGFVVKKEELSNLLNTTLLQLGLNNTETKEFVSYWTKVLPASPYYFIGVIPQATLDALASLTIKPQPKSIIRVTLYFEALDSFKSVNKPTIQTPTRTGFTVVEWGGLFKKDPKHPFSCFM